jgi:2-phosphosulfolactate phosphatase
MRSLNVHFLPSLVDPNELVGSTCVVIDVLRATTTIATALSAGARAVIPCLEIEDARRAAAALPTGSYLLGGERGGKKITGFQLGNSPSEYKPEVVKDRTIVFTTTNGTRALLACRGAELVLCGAFVNLSAVYKAIQSNSNVHLICAGTDGRISREDVLLAGAMADRLAVSQAYHLNDEAIIAISAWRELSHFDNIALGKELENSRGGRNLVELGMENDILLASQLNTTVVVPQFAQGRITLLDERVVPVLH